MIRSLFTVLLFSAVTFAGTNVRNFRLNDINNQKVSFEQVKGEKVTIVDFWATWCKPCIKAIPKLNKLQADYGDQGLKVVGISTDSPRNSAKIKPFARTYNIEYTILRDPNSEIASELSVSSYPTLFIVNSENEIVYTHIGFKPGDEKVLITEIERLLK